MQEINQKTPNHKYWCKTNF